MNASSILVGKEQLEFLANFGGLRIVGAFIARRIIGIDDGEPAKEGLRWRSEKSDLFTPSLTISHQMA